MNVSAKTEYAAIAMLELAANYGSDRPVRIRQIAASHVSDPGPEVVFTGQSLQSMAPIWS